MAVLLIKLAGLKKIFLIITNMNIKIGSTL